MFCPTCGAENPDSSRFCQKCGSSIPLQDVQQPPTQQTPTTQIPLQQTPVQQTPQIHTPVITHPANMVPGAGQSGAAVAANPSRRPLMIVLVALIVVALICVAFICSNVIGKGASKASNSQRATTTYTVDSNGNKVQLLSRPVLATLSDVQDAMGATPGLAAYDEEFLANSGAQGTQFGNSVIITESGEEPKVTNNYGDVEGPTPASGLSNVANLSDFYLSDEIKQMLDKNMFVVDTRGSSLEFFDVYESNRYQELASFITTDSVLHTYHLYFAYLLKNLEADTLSQNLLQLTNHMLEKSLEQQQALAGTEWQNAADRNVAFFATALCLLDPNATPPASVTARVQSECAKILAASGMSKSGLTGNDEDYTQYKPRGYYEGNEKLERYFRAMMLYGRTHFLQNDAFNEDADDLNRSALLMNLALDDGSHTAADKDWESIYTITSFFAGVSDDCGFYEYLPLILSAYGNNVKVTDLPSNTQAWEKYKDLTSHVRAPQISSIIVQDEELFDQDDIKGFRFMGQRFSLDASIFQQLVHDNVNARLLPSALDVPAALGSEEALEILKDKGQTSYAGYSEQMEQLRTSIANADESVWQGSLYAQWLYTLNPLLVSKDDTFPAFMTSDEWDRKNLQTYQGSYTELKHDTILYSKQIIAEMGGGPVNHDDRGYVEPEPELYARLGNLAQATVEGLEQYGAINDKDKSEMKLLQEICSKLQIISEKELAGKEPSSEEYEFIKTYGGQLEHFWEEVNTGYQEGATKSMFSPAAIVADIATNGTDQTCLELGIGRVNSIYVLVPINGELHLTRGGVFSDYEFIVPISERMTDSTWREKLGIGGMASKNEPQMVDWVQDFTITK